MQITADVDTVKLAQLLGHRHSTLRCHDTGDRTIIVEFHGRNRTCGRPCRAVRGIRTAEAKLVTLVRRTAAVEVLIQLLGNVCKRVDGPLALSDQIIDIGNVVIGKHCLVVVYAVCVGGKCDTHIRHCHVHAVIDAKLLNRRLREPRLLKIDVGNVIPVAEIAGKCRFTGKRGVTKVQLAGIVARRNRLHHSADHCIFFALNTDNLDIEAFFHCHVAAVNRIVENVARFLAVG